MIENDFFFFFLMKEDRRSTTRKLGPLKLAKEFCFWGASPEPLPPVPADSTQTCTSQAEERLAGRGGRLEPQF